MPILKLKKKQRNVIENFTLFDPMSKADESLPIIRRKTGIVFDETTNEHYCLWEDHKENPRRMSCILDRLRELELIMECEYLLPGLASLEEITRIHATSLFNTLRNTENMSSAELKELSRKYDSVYFSSNTFSSALSAVGCSIRMTTAVIDGLVQNGMALIRPPGHHAMKNEFCGFCYFNNASIAAKVALSKGCKRVLIIDWDVHHGQGTQQAFYDDPRVLFISIHRYEKGQFWPNLREGNFNFIGNGVGRGFNFNIPLNETALKNEDYLAIFHQIILPVSYEFSPDFVIVSCGFDAAMGCQEGKMLLTPAMYSHFTSFLMNFANGKLVILLEGGYCLESLAEAATHTLGALLRKPSTRLIDKIGCPNRSTVQTILNVISVHKPYWKCFNFQPLPPREEFNEGPAFEHSSIPIHETKLEFKGIPSSEDVEAMCQYSKDEERYFASELKRLKEGTRLKTSQNSVCLSYDAEMGKHYNTMEKNHPERPARTEEIIKLLESSGISERVLILQSRSASEEELLLCHDSESVKLIKNSAESTPRDRAKLGDEYESIYFNEFTWNAALLAVGNLLQVVDSVCAGDSQAGLAVIRPPGHHAERDAPNGFCFFNNVSIAAKYAIARHHLRKILILDWDVHHGNGIQHCFEGDCSVLYISIHLFKGGNFFPFSLDADAHFVGVDQGKGFNVNVPWSRSGMGDGDYIAAMHQIVLPIAYEFDPDLVLVSAGFDAAVNDPLGGCNVTPECFGHMTNLLKCLANGNVILALEGGYNTTSISYCMAMCAKALLGDPIPPLEPGIAPSPSAVEDINLVIKHHKEFWQNLKFQVFLEPFTDVGQMERNEDVPVHNPTANICLPMQVHASGKSAIVGRHDTISPDKGAIIRAHDTISPDKGTVVRTHDTISPDKGAIVRTHDTISPDKGAIIRAHDTISPDKGAVVRTHDTISPDKGAIVRTHDTISPDKGAIIETYDSVSPDKDAIIETLDALSLDKGAILRVVDTQSHDKGAIVRTIGANSTDKATIIGTQDALSPDRGAISTTYDFETESLVSSIASLSISTPLNSQQNVSHHQYEISFGELEGAVGFSQENMEAAVVFPLEWCEHLPQVNPVPSLGFDAVDSYCSTCSDSQENWICLSCYKVFCGRYVNGHMLNHFVHEQHNLVLSFSDLSVWCYSCESYIHNQVLLEAKRIAHRSKFSEDLPVSAL